MPTGRMPCWSKGAKPDDGGDEMFCHVRDPKHGEGDVAEGNAAKPTKSSTTSSSTHTRWPHLSLRRRSRVLATWRDVETAVDHLVVKALATPRHRVQPQQHSVEDKVRGTYLAPIVWTWIGCLKESMWTNRVSIDMGAQQNTWVAW